MQTFLAKAKGLRRGPDVEALSPAWVVVRDGVVESVTGQRPAITQDMPQIELGWLIEPLCDAHVHMFLCGSFDADERKLTSGLSPGQSLERMLALLQNYRKAGICVVRDGGGPTGVTFEAARIAATDPGKYARLMPTGEPVFKRGSYGKFLGLGAGSVEEAFDILDENKAKGATHAKILATGINSIDTVGEVGAGGFTPGEVEIIAAYARGLGLGVMMHANGSFGPLLKALPDSVEHGFNCGGEDIEALAGSNVVWTPTFGAWAELLRHPGLSPAQKSVVEKVDQAHREHLATALKLGAKVAAGSDAGTPGVAHVTGTIGEIIRLADAGMGMAGALVASTWHASNLMPTQHLRAGLTPGHPAAFASYERDPVENPSLLGAPSTVYFGATF